MGRTLIAALFLAQHAANAINIPGNFANLAAAATTTNPAASACAIAYGVIDACYSASPGLSTAAASDAASCLCCVSTVEVDEYYSSCADYISSSFPKSSTQYAAFTGIADACASEMPVCGAGAGAGGGGSATSTVTSSATNAKTTATSTATKTSGGGGAGGGTVPDACTSFEDIISSCVAATPSITAAPDSVAASCVCYATKGGKSSFTTEIDDLASSCAPWAKTAASASFYSGVVAFEDFCESYSPVGTKTRTSAAGTDTETSEDAASTTSTTSRTGGGVAGGTGTTTARTTSTTRTTATTAAAASTTTSRASGNVAAPAGAGGLVVWTAEMFSVVLGFFLLI